LVGWWYLGELPSIEGESSGDVPSLDGEPAPISIEPVELSPDNEISTVGELVAAATLSLSIRYRGC